MEAAPRLPMISFDLKTITENVSFGPKLKQYIASFYHEDPESYNNEIHNLESLRSSAVRPAIDVTGCQILKQYYCQLKFLKSRFPMEKGQAAAVSFSWKDLYSDITYTLSDINFELHCILFNIGALHSQLGAADTRSSSEGMKMSCTHFQCAAWAFQHLRENYSQMITVALLPEVINFMQQLCLAQAQECILEKSMMDNRKSSIIAKVAVQLVDYYNSALQIITSGYDYSTLGEVVSSRVLKVWNRHLKFKIAYHSCISLLYQGQQAEEAQKMGERVAYYQAASEQLEEARKIAKGNMGQQQHEVDEALAFTQDVVEGKKKAAKNENEFIYHEVVPEKDALQQVNGASLVKGTPFSFNDPEVSGKDLFSRLVPMEAHEASSLYSEQKAEMLRQIGAIVETKDAELVEFMSSLQIDCLTQWRQAIGVPQDVVDRAAAICAKPQATQALVDVMGKLAGTCHEVESLLSEIQELIKEEEAKEQEYQKIMGNRPPSIVSTDLSREAGKYSEAHSKANESNQTLHRAMMMHMSNLKILAQPLSELKKAIPCALPGDPSIDEATINELQTLISKVDEMRAQRATLVSQLREAVFADDITALLVTKPPDLSMEQLFQKELTKHKRQASLIEQNLAAQDNILAALTDVYAKFSGTRRYVVDILKRREATASALIASYDAYDDLLAKANKGIEFYQKLEGNVTKLQQRVKSACRVNEEEREQMLAKSGTNVAATNLPTDPITSATPKLKDYLASMKATSSVTDGTSQWVPAIRPTPLGQEETSDKRLHCDSHPTYYPTQAPQSAPTNIQYPYQTPGNYYPSVAPSVTGSTISANSQQYSYTDANAYYAYNHPGITNPPIAETVSVSVAQNYPTNYYQNPEQSQQSYQYPSTYNSTSDPKTSSVSQTYQVPYYPPTDTKTNPTYQIQGDYYPTSNTNLTSNVQQNYQIGINYSVSDTKTSQYPQNYQIPTNYPTDLNVQQSLQHNYQMPAGYYQVADSYTPSSTPQMNYPTPGIYSPSTDTSAPSQKLATQVPSDYSINNYVAPEYKPFPQIPPTVVVENTAVSTGYTYPTNYQGVKDSSTGYTGQHLQQYQAPSEEYQKQYQYVPQYYSNSNYQQTTQYQQSISNDTSSSSGYESQHIPENNESHQNVESSNQNYYSTPYGYQTLGNNPMTMIHANNNSSSKSTTSASAVSNVDLLTGLDFSLSQAPLEPVVNKPAITTCEEKSEVKKESSIETPTKLPEKPAIKHEEKKEITLEKPTSDIPIVQDPLADPEIFNSFSQEVDKLEKFVDSLCVKTLNGPTSLDIKWKEIQEQQERDTLKSSISVARCYPMKNRFPDIMPYDHSRVELPSTKDDYINASHIKKINPYAPSFIITQAPLKSTFDDFWTMVWEQQIEIIVCMLGDAEMQQEASVYWPTERGAELQIGKFRLVLQGINHRDYWVERIISIGDGNKNLVVVHIQFTGWPGGGLFPTTVFPVLSLSSAVLGCHRQQRIKNRPVLIHCLSGVGRSGVLCVITAAMCDPLQSLDVANAALRISHCRKNVLRDREHLKFTYQAVLQHFKDLLSGKQLQTKIQNINIATDESSSRRSSVSSEASTDQSKQRKKFTPESFGTLKEQGITPVTDVNDPFSALDPLWTIRK